MIRKLAYIDAFIHAIRHHLRTFHQYPPKQLMGL